MSLTEEFKREKEWAKLNLNWDAIAHARIAEKNAQAALGRCKDLQKRNAELEEQMTTLNERVDRMAKFCEELKEKNKP